MRSEPVSSPQNAMSSASELLRSQTLLELAKELDNAVLHHRVLCRDRPRNWRGRHAQQVRAGEFVYGVLHDCRSPRLTGSKAPPNALSVQSFQAYARQHVGRSC
jgi:hypothetical protein